MGLCWNTHFFSRRTGTFVRATCQRGFRRFRHVPGRSILDRTRCTTDCIWRADNYNRFIVSYSDVFYSQRAALLASEFQKLKPLSFPKAAAVEFKSIVQPAVHI